MDFEQVIKAHTYWKVTLRWMINGESRIDAAKTADPNQCELGAWIHGAGKAYANNSEFSTLCREHAEFHRIAAEVVVMVGNGQKSEAEAMLAPDGAFSQASVRTMAAIRALKMQVEMDSSSAG